MKRTTALLTAVLMGSAVAGFPAMSQAASDATGANSNVNDVDRGTNKDAQKGGDDASMKSDNGSMKSDGGSMMSGDQMMNMLKTADVAQVKIAKGSDAANTDHTNAQGTVSDTSAKEQAKLQAAIEANPDLVSMLKDQSIDPSQVVSAEVGANKSITLHVK